MRENNMKYVDGLTRATKRELKLKKISERKEWHKWFAWYPVEVDETKDGHKIKIWMQYVNRRALYDESPSWPYFLGWQYSEI